MTEPVLEISDEHLPYVKTVINSEKNNMILYVKNADTGRPHQRTISIADPKFKEKAHDFIALHRTKTGKQEAAKEIARELVELADKVMTNKDLTRLHNEFPETKLEDLPVMIGTNKYMASSFLIIGQSRMSGKTKLLVSMYKTWFKKHKDWIVILFAGNPQNELYAKFKRALIFDRFNEEILENLREIQRKTNNHYTFVIILDDILSMRYRHFLEESVLTYRNSNIYMIIATQYYTLVSPAARTNFTWLFLGKFSRAEAIEKMSKSILLTFPGRTPQQKFQNYKYLTREDREDWTNRWIVMSSDDQTYSLENNV